MKHTILHTTLAAFLVVMSANLYVTNAANNYEGVPDEAVPVTRVDQANFTPAPRKQLGISSAELARVADKSITWLLVPTSDESSYAK